MSRTPEEAEEVIRVLVEALTTTTQRLRHIHGLRLDGETRVLDFGAEMGVAHSALALAEGKKP